MAFIVTQLLEEDNRIYDPLKPELSDRTLLIPYFDIKDLYCKVEAYDNVFKTLIVRLVICLYRKDYNSLVKGGRIIREKVGNENPS